MGGGVGNDTETSQYFTNDLYVGIYDIKLIAHYTGTGIRFYNEFGKRKLFFF